MLSFGTNNMLLLLQGYGQVSTSVEGDVALSDYTVYAASVSDTTAYAVAVSDSTPYSVTLADEEVI